MAIKITVDVAGLEARIKRLRAKEIPSAMRHALNDLAFDSRARTITEMKRVFDRPTPVVLRLPWVKRQATNADKPPVLSVTDWFNGKGGRGPTHALPQHIPGQLPIRARKGMEKRLESLGLIGPNEWMMPSRFVTRDAYGNVKGSVVSKMLADIGGYGRYSGDAANTGSGVAGKRRSARRKVPIYFWATIKGTKGIWRKVWDTPVPQFVAVSKTPTYAKRFRFHAVISVYSLRRMAYHADRAIAQQIRRRG